MRPTLVLVKNHIFLYWKTPGLMIDDSIHFAVYGCQIRYGNSHNDITMHAKNQKISLPVILASFALLMILSCGKNRVDPVGCPYPRPADAYVYPVLPGTAEWKAMASVAERVEACQIPTATLKTLSTDALIDSWVNFPFAFDLYASSNFQRGMGFWMNNFSGLQELSLRNDAGTRVLEYFKRMNPACAGSANYTFLFTYVAMLTGQNSILEKLTEREQKSLVAEALASYTINKSLLKMLGVAPTDYFSLWICSRAMENFGYQPFVKELDSNRYIKNFNSTAMLVNTDKGDEISIIIKHALNFIK
jgi:hypothetical protein